VALKTTANPIFDIATEFVLHSRQHIFLTGKAGTGKTTFLKHLRDKRAKNMVIVAPTGVAAINAGGVTLHSFFQLPMGSFLPGRHHGFSNSPADGTDLHTLLKNIRFNRDKRRLLEELELLVIDEVSMLRADLLDAIDGILRHFRKNLQEPFGGVQMLYIGDLYQLPPVVSNDEWGRLSQYYKSMFFFDALVMSEASPLTIELEKIYRQSDNVFIDLLNNIRNNIATEDDLLALNKHHDPYFHPDAEDGYIILTSHNYKADRINQQQLARLESDVQVFEGVCTGEFNENALPVEKKLALKRGAQIMFIRNDKGDQRRYYNGKIGYISRMDADEIFVRFPGQREELQLEVETWRTIRYNYNESADKIEEEELGSYKQYPIRLAWAVTIHKSQGLTFEKAIVDAGESFAAGQVYVALSRLTSLKGLVLGSAITPASISTDPRVTAFSQFRQNESTLQSELEKAQLQCLGTKMAKAFIWDTVLEAFQENHKEYNTRKLLSQGEAVTWSAEMLHQLASLSEVGRKFTVQLGQLFPEAKANGYKMLHERTLAAYKYFIKQIDEVLLRSFQAHYDVFRLKTKTKKYIRELDMLKLAIQRKRQQIMQAEEMARGLSFGQQPAALLQQFMAAGKPVLKSGFSDEDAINMVKEESKAISLKLLKDGKSIDEIATIRGLAKSTVEGHLTGYVISGEIALDLLVPSETQEAIRKAVKHSGEYSVSAIRNALGNTFTYNEVRAVIAQIEKEEGRKTAAN
jgi:hypothetical protein